MDEFTVEAYADRESWLVGRARSQDGAPSVSASEVAALFVDETSPTGTVSPWTSRRSLYESKVAPESFIEPETERLYWGRRLEPVIAEEITVRHGWELDDFGRFTLLRSNRWPFLTTTLDRRIRPIDARGYGVAECKNAGFMMRDEWNENGAPLYVQIQGQTQLAVTGYRWGVFPVLIGGCEWRMVEFARDDAFIELIVKKAQAFMLHVVHRIPPGVDGSDATTEAFKRRWPRDDGATVTLPEDALQWDRAIAQAKDDQAKAAAVEELNKNRLREFLGEATYGDLPGRVGRWSWKADKNGKRSLKRVECPVEKRGKAA